MRACRFKSSNFPDFKSCIIFYTNVKVYLLNKFRGFLKEKLKKELTFGGGGKLRAISRCIFPPSDTIFEQMHNIHTNINNSINKIKYNKLNQSPN